MPRLVHENPAYRHHKQSGNAVVTLDGRDHYLGPWKSKESREKYDRLISEWLANGRRLPADGMAVVELAAAYWRHVKEYYRKPDGTPTSEQDTIKQALKPLTRLFGKTPVAEFGPLRLKAVRDAMIEHGWCRRHVNKQVGRLRQFFKWATENELAPAAVYHALQAVAGLKYGRTGAKESDPVTPVPEQYVYPVLPLVSAQVRAMIELQLLTGMRPGEACQMRTADVDATGRLWEYRPATHKTAHHGHERVVYLGPKAQAVLRPFLKPDLCAHVFSPADAEDARRKALHDRRKTPPSCGNRPGTNRSANPKRQPGDRYDVASYRRAIARGCDKAFPPPEDATAGLSAEQARSKLREWRRAHRWHPHRLRHTAGTRLRKEYGLEAAQVILGHKTLTVTQVYAEKNISAAQRVMAEAG